jgi:hypothetical protein
MNTDPSRQPFDASPHFPTGDGHRCHEGRYKIGTAIGIVTTIAATFAACSEARTEETRLTAEQARAASAFESTYIVLPPPTSLDPDAVNAESDKLYLSDYFGNDKIATTGESVNTESITINDLRDRDINCESLACEEALNAGAALTNKVVYLIVENIGETEASNIRIEFESTTPENAEVTVLESLFSSPSGEGNVSEQIGDLKPGGRVLVPLASVAIVNEGLSPGFVGVGNTREPLTIYWSDIYDDDRSADVRSPNDSLALIPAMGVLTGG